MVNETEYLLSNEANRKRLYTALKQAENGELHKDPTMDLDPGLWNPYPDYYDYLQPKRRINYDKI